MALAPARVGGFELPSGPRLPRVGTVDAVALEERAATPPKLSIRGGSRVRALGPAVGMRVRPPLGAQDPRGRGAALCSRGRRPDPADLSVPPVAAVCIY